MRPLVILDTETTGVEIAEDKVIQFAAIKLNPETWEEIDEAKNVLFNPGRPIPKQASDVHGILDEHVKDKPFFKAYSKAIAAYLDGCDYGGHNIIQFDVPMLAEEFAACGISWPRKGANYYDSLHVFREKEKRDLAGAMRFYCRADHVDAHDALADVRAAAQVIFSQRIHYPELGKAEDYAKFCENPKALDLCGKLELNDDGVAVYAFGKDKGKGIKENPSFGYWMLKQKFSTNTLNILKSIIFSK